MSDSLVCALIGPCDAVSSWPEAISLDSVGDDDLQLALYCCYELAYRGFAGVDEGWEWEPTLLSFRRKLEQTFEAQLRAEVDATGGEVAAAQVVAELWDMTRRGGVSLSTWALEHGTLEHAREFAVHRSGYQLKEADPHSWGLPRLSGRAKAALVTIQSDEYGNGVVDEQHCSLFAVALRALGLDDRYGAYLNVVPAETLATTNLISLFGMHRRLRAALIGHLASFEMNSVGPMGRYSAWLRQLGVSDRGRRFYDVHVQADAVHQHVAADELVGGFLELEPGQGAEVLFGARALSFVEGRFASHLMGCWTTDRSSLVPELQAS